MLSGSGRLLSWILSDPGRSGTRLFLLTCPRRSKCELQGEGGDKVAAALSSLKALTTLDLRSARLLRELQTMSVQAHTLGSIMPLVTNVHHRTFQSID